MKATDMAYEKKERTSWPDHRWLILAALLLLVWIVFVLVSYFNLLIHHPVITFNLATVWANNSIVLLPVVILLLFGVVVWLLPESLVGRITAITVVLITVALLVCAADRLLWLKAIIFFGSAGLAGLGTKRLYDKLTSANIPYWMGLILALILFHYWLFIIGLLGFFRLAITLPIILVLVGVGLYELYSHQKQYASMLWSTVRQFSRVEAIFLVGLWLVLAAGFIGASAPETYSDAMRLHIPFMSNVVRNGALTPDYYTYSHIMLSPIQLLGAGGYIFLGELGGKWFAFLIGILSIAIITSEVSHFTNRRSLGLATGFLIISMPYFWQWLTTAYQDLPLTGFSLASLAVLGRALKSEPKLVPLAGLFLGFAAATKLTTLAFIAPILLVIFLVLLLTRNKSLLLWLGEFWRTWWPAILLFLLAMLPWYVLVWRWTGNPVFPALDNLFPSPYLTEALKAAFFREEPAQGFPDGWFDGLIYPWVVTFQTHFFSETLDGALGPGFLLFFPIIPLGFLVNHWRGDHYSNRVMFILLVIAIVDIGAISLYIVPQLRYLMPGMFLLLICAFGLAWKNILPLLQRVIPAQIMTLGAILLVSGSLLILFGWGIFVDSYARLPWRVYAGYQTPAEYLKARTGGVDIYINRNLRPGESVLATDFEQLNTIAARTIYFSDWLPPQAIGLETAEQFEAFLANNNVRYWIVSRTSPTTGTGESGFIQKYLTEDRLVRSLGPVDLYTLKPELEPSPPELIQIVTLSSQFQWINDNDALLPIPSEANYVAGEVLIKANQDATPIQIQQLWLGSGNQEIGKCIYNVVGHKNIEMGLPIGCRIPSEASSLSVIIHAQQPQNGTFDIVGGEIRWKKFVSEPMPPLTIIDFDPTQVKVGQDFNTQRNGYSNLRIKTQNATEQVILVSGTEKLSINYISPDLITVRVPEAYYTVPGTYQFYLFDTLTERRSNTAEFVVTE